MSITDWCAADQAAHVFAYHADSLEFLRKLPNDWCHAIITDPPYGLADHKPERVVEAITAWANGDREQVPTGRGFMGREWDAFVPPPALWDECLRVLKPGGHLAVFAGSRTVDLMGLSIRLAGFEMRDGVAAWLYGSGFPKSLDVGKAIDKGAGAERTEGAREWRGGQRSAGIMGQNHGTQTVTKFDAPATDAAREWQGWGTALKPAHEPILLARKPLAGTVAANVLAHRAGGINVDACRVAHRDEADLAESVKKNQHTNYANPGSNRDSYSGSMPERTDYDGSAGRWPTNVVYAHHPDCGPEPSGDFPCCVAPRPCAPGCQVAALDEQSGNRPGFSGGGTRGAGFRTEYVGGESQGRTLGATTYGDTGGASRFFPTFRYQAKAPKSERPEVRTHSCRCEDPWPITSPARATDVATTADSSNTSRSGSDATGAESPTGTTSITSTSTSSTTTPRTSSSSTSSPTSASTPDASSATASGGSPVGSAASSSPSTSSTGTSPARGGRSTGGAGRATSREWSETSVCGRCGAPSRLKGHETVKPLGLMRWLVRLLVPVTPGHAGMVVDPFAGSGATLEAARLEGVRVVGIERDEHSARLIAKRLGVPFHAPEPAPVELLLRTVVHVRDVPSLKTLARGAVRAELWSDDVRAAFTARRVELEAATA